MTSNNLQSEWMQDAENGIKNRKWLRYSSNIARRILAAIEDRPDYTQAALAEELGVQPQYVSKVVKGKENLSLETIAKFSEVLGTELITFPEYKDTKPVVASYKIDCGWTAAKIVVGKFDRAVCKTRPFNVYISSRYRDNEFQNTLDYMYGR
jgi:transcriptional regulator with XRE-family HTH domain